MSSFASYPSVAKEELFLVSPTFPPSLLSPQDATAPPFTAQLPRRLTTTTTTSTATTTTVSSSTSLVYSSKRAAPRAPVRFAQPSILDLLTALPLLLSLDHADYAAGLSDEADRAAAAAAYNHARLARGGVHGTRRSAINGAHSTSGDDDGVDFYGDTATAAVRTVLYSSGSPSLQARRRRLRRVALDAFFRASLPAQISARQRGGCKNEAEANSDEAASSVCAVSDGVRVATLRLLAHTRAVMAEVSPTQAHLVDLFADQILLVRDAPVAITNATSAAVGSTSSSISCATKKSISEGKLDRTANQKPAFPAVAASEEKEKKASVLRGIVSELKEAALSSTQKGSQSPRSIMKPSTMPPPTTVTTAAAPAELVASQPQGSSSIAEQLLYIILRTSIAANTPLRGTVEVGTSQTAQDNVFPGKAQTCTTTPPPPPSSSLLSFLPAFYGRDADNASSPSRPTSSVGSLVRKKARHDVPDDEVQDADGTVVSSDAVSSPAALFSHAEEESIRHHPAAMSLQQQHKGDTSTALLPYDPQCWLGPSTVALVEHSASLRQQQRWTCDGDPVIEATIAGEGSDAYYNRAHSVWSAVENGEEGYRDSSSSRQRWAPLMPRIGRDANDAGDARILSFLARDGALPFRTSAVSWKGDTKPAESCGLLHWGLADINGGGGDAEMDAQVNSLFVEHADRDEDAENTEEKGEKKASQTASAAAQLIGKDRASRKAAREAHAVLPPLPSCRTPFVLCSTLYDPVVYAHVHVALHRCTAGLVDPYDLTYYDDQAGPNLVEIRVRAELYATAKKGAAPAARSGLTAMLEWGCTCGTLLLRLHRLCEVAAEATMRASLGHYGRSAMDTLRLILCLLQRQMYELGDRVGGAHRLTFTELLTAQQRLQTAAAQVEALAMFFNVPSTSAAAAASAAATKASSAASRTKSKLTVAASPAASSLSSPASPLAWDPVAVLQQTCCSALLVSRLHHFFTTRQANALGQHSSLATNAYAPSQHDTRDELLGSLGSFSAANNPRAGGQMDPFDVVGTEEERLAWQQQRSDLLCGSLDAIGLLLRATLRPFNAMLHRWLTAGEVVDPYDEFFVVPSHGQTPSGFTLDTSPQRLPAFVSAAAAHDLLHAGVSLRVLRAAATHVVLSAQKDARRLQGLAEATDAAAEDFAEELLDTQTLQHAIQQFIERLVRGAPTVEGVQAMGRVYGGASPWMQQKGRDGESEEEESGSVVLPLPPRVDVLSAYGAINWWRQHYQACTQVLLEAVEDAAAARAGSDDDEDVDGAGEGQRENWKRDEEAGEEGRSLAQASAEAPLPISSNPRNATGASNTSTAATVQEVEGSLQAEASQGSAHVKTVSQAAQQENEEEEATGNAGVTVSLEVPQAALRHLVYPPGLSPSTATSAEAGIGARGADPTHSTKPQTCTDDDEEAKQQQQPYITVFMNSDEDSNIIDEESRRDREHGRQAMAQISNSDRVAPSRSSSSSSPSSPTAFSSSSAAASSVLGLRHIAGSKLSIGTTVSSTASSRGTLALYGAITEELRQVSLLEQQTELQIGQSRHALRAEFDAQMWRRRRDARLAEWKAQRLSLRLRRLRAMNNVVDELREVYGVRGVADGQPSSSLLSVKENINRAGDASEAPATAVEPAVTVVKVVVPLSTLPPLRAAPPVVLYAEEPSTAQGPGRRGRAGQSAQTRRTSFAATTTVIELPRTDAPLSGLPHQQQQQQLVSAQRALSTFSPHRLRAPTPRSASGPSIRLPVATAGTSSAAMPPSPHAHPRSRSLPSGTRTYVPRSPAQAWRVGESDGNGGAGDRGSTAQKAESADEEGSASRSRPASSENSGAVRQLRDVTASALHALGTDLMKRPATTFATSTNPTGTNAQRKGASSAEGGGNARVSQARLALHRNKEENGREGVLQPPALVSGGERRRTTVPPAAAAAATTAASTTGGAATVVLLSENWESNEEDGVEMEGCDVARVRCDELGYAHPDELYVVADINDDEFLLMRTGPKSYARRDAEQAALARLAARQAELNQSTVDAPDIMAKLRLHAAREANDDIAEEDAVVQDAEFAERASRCGPCTAVVETAAEADEQRAENEETEDVGDTSSLDHHNVTSCQQDASATAWPLSELWGGDDPLEVAQRSGRPLSSPSPSSPDCTHRLWSWAPAEAHRWYFDHRVPLHHVLTGREIDRTLLLDLPLSTDEAEALQRCGGYYRALGQYTASFLTHKALQLTLLPPYGALYRLTTQFLDVCLLQQAPVAVRVVDSWIASVDAALMMMAEKEEETMMAAVVAGAVEVPAPLATLTDQQRGVDSAATLAALNAVFQREWAGCVQDGSTTVTLAWVLSDSNQAKKPTAPLGSGALLGQAHTPRLMRSAPRSNVSVSAEEKIAPDKKGRADLLQELDSDAEDGPGGSTTRFGLHHFDPEHDEAQAGNKSGHAASLAGSRARTTSASPIQSFLERLQLTAVSPWCSGAWLLPSRTTEATGTVFRTLLFWKTVERLVLHTWRAGMESGLSTVFFFCTTVRQVLLSTLHEQLWARLTELTTTYRGRLRFEAGVLYTYRALENFTVDNEQFLQDCEFYTLCSEPFQRRVRPLLLAMMREVEVAERALRFAQVSTRVARRQYMATYRSMVSGSESEGENSSSDNDDDGDGARRKRNESTTKATSTPSPSSLPSKAGAAATLSAASGTTRPALTPSRWSRAGRHASGSTKSTAAASGGTQATPWYLHPIEAAIAQHDEQATTPTHVDVAAAAEAEDGSPLPGKRVGKRKQASLNSSATTTTNTTATLSSRGGSRASDAGGPAAATTKFGQRSTSAMSNATSNTIASASLSASPARAEEDSPSESQDEEESSSAHTDDSNEEGDISLLTTSTTTATAEDQTETTATKAKKKKRRRRRTAAQTSAKTGPPRRSIMESATMNTTPIYASVLAAHQQQRLQHPAAASPGGVAQKRGRSAGASHRLPPMHPPHAGTSTTALPPTPTAAAKSGQAGLRRCKPRRKGPRLTPAERQERKEKLRAIAQRKIEEETEHQRRRMRDVIARRLRRFAALTQALRDALSEVITEEDVAAQAALAAAVESVGAAKEVHDVQRQQMDRFTYLSAMVRRLDTLVEVMASQV